MLFHDKKKSIHTSNSVSSPRNSCFLQNKLLIKNTHTNTHIDEIVNLVIIYYASTAVQDVLHALSFSNVTLTSQDRFYFKVGKPRYRKVV